MIQDPKALLAAAGGAVATVPVLMAAIFPGLKTGHLILVIAGIIVTAALSYLGLWLFKQQTVRDQATETRLDGKFKELRDDLKKNSSEIAILRGVIDKAVLTHKYLGEQIAAVVADVERAESRLSQGGETISKMREDIAALKSRAAYGNTRRQNDVDG